MVKLTEFQERIKSLMSCGKSFSDACDATQREEDFIRKLEEEERKKKYYLIY